MLTSYGHLVNILLEIFATNDIIAEAVADTTNYKERQDVKALDYSQSLGTKALHCGLLLDKD